MISSNEVFKFKGYHIVPDKNPARAISEVIGGQTGIRGPFINWLPPDLSQGRLAIREGDPVSCRHTLNGIIIVAFGTPRGTKVLTLERKTPVFPSPAKSPLVASGV